MIIIDRFEGDYAVCETDNGMKNIEISLLPHNVREGSVLRYVGGEYVLDAEAEQERRQNIYNLQKKLFKKSEP